MLGQRRQQKSGEKLPALSAWELKEQAGAALNDLENFRSRECAAGVESILCHELSRDVEEAFREIQRQLKLYEDDNAEALLRELLSKLDKEKGVNE